jgi:uncharacterized protein
MSFLSKVSRDGIMAEVERPNPAKVITGDPVHTTWNMDDTDGLYCGMWQSTPGKWHVNFTDWEYVYIHQGVNILTDLAGHAVTLRAGDSFVIRPGFQGTWEVTETTLKDYVIRTT